jgi:zinc protease
MTRMILGLLVAAGLALAADAPKKAFPYGYEQHDFPNGLRLVTIPTDYPNVAALYIVVQTGSRNEVEPGKSGFAHLFEHMMFRGTKAYPTAKYEATLKTVGAASNAYTSDDRTVYHTTFSKEDLETIVRMEADRFQNLEYTQEVFKTETLAVLGEYNKNSSAPTSKLYEVLRNTAFDKHTYKHSTMGFLEDIRDMPNQYEYSRQFFDRYYRPEYTTIVVAGDVDKQQVRSLVEKYWGEWRRGRYSAPIPPEPAQDGARTNEVQWKTPTLPWVTVAFKGPAYSDTQNEMAVLDVISFLGFSESSDLYQKLVIQEQKVDVLQADNPDHVDPYLFTIWARVKKADEVAYVRDEIVAAFGRFKEKPVSKERLEATKNHLRYRFALGMDNSQSIADTVAHYVALRRTPETMNRLYDMYAQITVDDLQKVAKKYFVEKARTIVTLKGGKAQ